MEVQKSEIFLVGYNVENIAVTSILISLLCLFCYLVFFRFRSRQLWKFGLVKLYLGAISVLISSSLILLLFSSFQVYQHRENLINNHEGIHYIEGVPSLGKIPYSIKDVDGPQMSIATLQDVIFPVGRYPSDCINGKFIYRFNKASQYYSGGMIFKAWYAKKATSGYLKKLQGYSACLIKLEISRK